MKFTPEKGRIILEVKEESPAEESAPTDAAETVTVLFAVHDSGIGIAKEDQDKIGRASCRERV